MEKFIRLEPFFFRFVSLTCAFLSFAALIFWIFYLKEIEIIGLSRFFLSIKPQVALVCFLYGLSFFFLRSHKWYLGGVLLIGGIFLAAINLAYVWGLTDFVDFLRKINAIILLKPGVIGFQMSEAASFVLLSLGFSGFCSFFLPKRVFYLTLSAFFAEISLGISLIVLVGNFFSIAWVFLAYDTPLGWLAALIIMVLSCALIGWNILSSLPDYRRGLPAWVTLVIASGLVLCILGFWQGVRQEEIHRSSVQMEEGAHAANLFIYEDIEGIFSWITRIAPYIEPIFSKEKTSPILAKLQPSVIGIIFYNDSGVKNMVFNRQRVAEEVDLNAIQKEWEEQSWRLKKDTKPDPPRFFTYLDGHAIYKFHAIEKEESGILNIFVLYDVSYNFEKSLNRLLNRDWGFKITQDGHTILERPLPRDPGYFEVKTSVSIGEIYWDFELWGSPAYWEERISQSSVFILAFGLFLVAMVTAVFYLATRAYWFSYQEMKASDAKMHFLASMSHEIRTPLNGIVSSLSILEMTPLNEKQEKIVNIMNLSADHLLHLINDILDLTKILEGEFKIKEQLFSPKKILDEVYLLLKTKAQEKGLELLLEVADDFPEQILSDPYRVKQVLINFVNNALKFTDKGYVLIKGSLENKDRHNYLRVDVIDSGVGIKEEDQENLFKVFSQVGSEVKKKEGSGLGLSISKKIVHLLGGDIIFESEWGKGSSFGFRLPLL